MTAARLLAALCAAIVMAMVGAAPPHAQTQPAAARPLDAPTFLRHAHSLAVLQARASEIVARRDTREEARTFAQRMIEFRGRQIPRLEALAKEGNLAIPAQLEFEHRVLLDNLQPLDLLALSRRYAEVEVQALEQENAIHVAAARGPDNWTKTLAAEFGPELGALLEAARETQRAVGP
jgi:predicted outer membrane protein